MTQQKEFEKEVIEETVIEKYSKQMAEKQAIEIDKNFWLVVNKKPKWMPSFIYRAVIKLLVEIHYYKN